MFAFWTDGFPICWESCILCSVGSCCFTIHGVAGFLYPEVAHCWRSWDSIADSCWSWGAIKSSSFLFILSFNVSGLQVNSFLCIASGSNLAFSPLILTNFIFIHAVAK
jgi:hypothetical protein